MTTPRKFNASIAMHIVLSREELLDLLNGKVGYTPGFCGDRPYVVYVKKTAPTGAREVQP